MTRERCSRCLYWSDHPLGIVFDTDGVCSGCRTHQEKMDLDWDWRFSLLEKRLSKALRRRKSDHDCVVAVRGTPEYFYEIEVLTNQLGLRVLAVNYNSQFGSDVGIRNLARLRDRFDLDFMSYTTNPVTYRKLVRESILRLGSLRWPVLAGETQLPVRIALERRVPMVIWPYHQPTEMVGTHSYLEEIEMTRAGRHSFDLMGIEPLDMITHRGLLQPYEVEDLLYPSDGELDRSGLTGLYLANYLPWDSRRYAEEAVANMGALSARNERTFDTYDRVDDLAYMGFHDMLKVARHGYGRVTDSLCREIRFGRIDRQTALELEDYYLAQFPGELLAMFSDWIGATADGLEWIATWEASGRLFPGEVERNPSEFANLSDTARAFVAGFEENHAPLMSDRGFTLLGKGLEIDELA